MIREDIAGRNLAEFGESLCCYVPRLFRLFKLKVLISLSYVELPSYYETDSWAIDDLVLLLRRIADEVGMVDSEIESTVRLGNDGVPIVDRENAGPTPSNRRVVLELAESVSQAVSAEAELRNEPHAASFWYEATSCANDEEMQAEFDSMQQVLFTHTTHPLLNEELREFLEPGDRDIPTEFIGDSVREVLETPFARLARRWVDRRRVRCLLNLLSRAVVSIRSLTGCPDEDTSIPNDSLRPRTTPVSREISDDGKSWRTYCDIIHEHGLEWMKLGTVAACLRDLPRTLWDCPLADFTVLTLRKLAEMPAIGPKRLATVTAPVRSVALDLQGLPRSSNVRVKLIPGPLRGVHTWIQRVMESRVIPSVNDVATQLVRPLSCQLLHDLTAREAQIAIHRLRLDESIASSTLEVLASVHGITRERIRQLESWGPRVLQVRFPQGRFLLEALHGFLAETLKAHEQASMVRQIACHCFDSTLSAVDSHDEALLAWEEAGRNKLTPMTAEQIHQWSGRRLPLLAPSAVFELVASHGLCLQNVGEAPRWFTRTVSDRLLFALHHRPGPTRLGELVLLDKLHHGHELATDESAIDLDAKDERNLKNKIGRDPRFVECDEHQLLPSERCGFERRDGRWYVRLVLMTGTEVNSADGIAIESLATLLVSGMLERRIVDATVWGVHRCANDMLARMYGTHATALSTSSPVIQHQAQSLSLATRQPDRMRNLPCW